MKGGRQRQEFREKQRYNQIVAQLNKLHQAGFTDEDIRNAGNDAWFELGGQTLPNGTLVVGDGDTLSTIAAKNGVTPPDILAANPDLKQLKTGMVISFPMTANSQMRGRGYTQPGLTSIVPQGGSSTLGGLPSNGTLGGATNNPQGVNMWQGVTPGYNTQLKPNTPLTNQSNIWGGNPYASYQYKPPKTPYDPNKYATPLQQFASQSSLPTFGLQPNAQASTVTPRPQPVRGMPTYTQSSLAGLQANRITELYNAVNNGKTMTQAQIDYAMKHGLIIKSGSGGGGYGGGYRRGRGGRGGGGGYGGGRAPSLGSGKVQQGDRLPAFSTGSGFNGLVNWRI